jgi:hypothetical protein
MGLLNDIYNDYKNQRERSQKQLKKYGWLIVLFYVLFFGGLCGGLYYYYQQENKENEANYNWSYELACENGDFQVAHKILSKLQEEVLYEKKFEKDHAIKKEKKTHWFKDDEYVVDSASLEDHNMFMENLQAKGRTYLSGLDYVYNAEIAYVKEMNEDGTSEKIKHLLSEYRNKLIFFKSIQMEEEAQNVYNNMLQKLNMQSVEITDSIM